MARRLITLDFWNTLVSAKSNGRLREAARIEALLEAGRAVKPDLDEAAVRGALLQVTREFDRRWLETAYTLRGPELVAALEAALGLRFLDAGAVMHRLQRSIFAGRPDWAPGAAAALHRLSAGFRLVVISDTMYSPGALLRTLFEEAGVAHCFAGFVFSDEMGCSKPDGRTFARALEISGCSPEEAVHIGDLQATDIRGAQAAGFGAVLYTGLNAADLPDTTADAVLDSWHRVESVLASLG